MTKPYVDPYAVLELQRTATAAEIKQAYFTQVRNHPPERDPETFKRIRAAYERLRDPERRTETDMLLLNVWPEPARKRRPPKLDLTLHHEDVLTAARALTDLERTDWREHYAKIKL
ncbi:MAG: J domain-containing protein [Chloroflexaceae bacterium]